MPPHLIVNADDFGLTNGINRSVDQLHGVGALTSATLMAVGSAFASAVTIARENDDLGVGCHLVFTDGTPICDPDTIPSLVQAGTGAFHPSFQTFLRAVLIGSVAEDELVREGVAQVDRLQAAGITVTHLDTHKHTHMLPVVTRALLRVAEMCVVGAIRNPFEPPWSMALGQGGMVRRACVGFLHAGFRATFDDLLRSRPSLRTTDGTIGVATTGRLTRHALEQILFAIPSSGTWELVVHPGYEDADLAAISTKLQTSREIERVALLECLSRGTRRVEPELIHYGDL